MRTSKVDAGALGRFPTHAKQGQGGMRRITLIGMAVLAALAISAAAASGASASTTLELTDGPTGPALQPGHYIQLYSGNDSLKYTYGGITPYGCFGGYEGIYGELLNNNARADKIRLNGDFGNLNEEDIAACNYPQHIAGFPWPWILTLSANGTAKVTGALEAYEVVGGTPYCPQEGTKIKAKATLGHVTLDISTKFDVNLGHNCSLGYRLDLGVMEAYGDELHNPPIFDYVR